MIAAYSTFAVLALEGMIIDTDHWRHFFLLIGVIWGMIATTPQTVPARNENQALIGAAGNRRELPA